MIENRAGAEHDALEASVPGVYVYSVDEERLPRGPLGFLDLDAQDLYYPNRGPPYLNVNLPVGCTLFSAGDANRCALSAGAERELVHASGERTGFTLLVGASQPDGTVRLTFRGPPAPAPDAGPAGTMDPGSSGCRAGGEASPAAGLVLLALVALLVRYRMG
jgi:MYXO-CTERM domain-containing protein